LPGSVHRRTLRAHRDCDVVAAIGSCAEVQAEFDDAAVARMPLSVGSGVAQDRRERVDRGFPQVEPVAVRTHEESELHPHGPGAERLKCASWSRSCCLYAVLCVDAEVVINADAAKVAGIGSGCACSTRTHDRSACCFVPHTVTNRRPVAAVNRATSG
jgi:hypothetical protein